MISLSLVYKGLKNLHLDLSLRDALIAALGVGLITAFAAKILITALQTRLSIDPLSIIETSFKSLQVITGGYMAFAFGANDVANGIGPFAAVYSVFIHKAVAPKAEISMFVLGLGGLGLVTGFAFLGYRVIETVGKKITQITPSRGFSAEFAAATTVLVCSKLGMPVSTTHTLVGAVIGVGLARGIGAIDKRIVKNIFLSWFITLPSTATLAAILFLFLRLFLF
jgi:PiT family inorganic phosphate transporter